MAFGVGDSLSVRISARTQSFERGINSAERSLTSLVDNSFIASSALQVLAGRADEAGDEISQTGRRATITSGAFSSLALSTEGLSLSFGSLSTVTTATLIPAVVALSSTLVPLTATLGALVAGATALAGAFGTIIGTGIIAFGAKRGKQNRERLQEVNARIERLEALQETERGLTAAQEEQLETLEERQSKLEEQTGIMGGLKSAISDLVAEIRPMLVEFGQRFIPLIEDAISAIPQLIRNILDAVGGFGVFERALRNAGQTAMTVIPEMISGLMELARTALPVLIDFGRWLIQNGPRIFRGMVQTAKEVGPSLLNITQAIFDLIPKINKLGIFITKNILPALKSTKGQFALLIPLIGVLGGPLTALAGIALLVAQNWDRFSDEINKIIKEGKELLPFLTNVGGDIMEVVIPAVEQLLSIVGGVLEWFNNLETWQKKGIIIGLAAAIGILGGPLAAIASAAVIAGTAWDWFMGIINAVANAVDTLHQRLVDLWNFLTQNQVAKTIGEVGQFLNQGPSGINTTPTSTAGDVSGTSFSQNQTVQVEVKGDTGVIEDVTARTIEDRERIPSRQSGTTSRF